MKPSRTASGGGDKNHPSQRTYSLRSKLSLALVVTLMILLVAEITVRIVGLAPEIRPIVVSGDSSPYRHSNNPILAYEHKSNYRNDHPDHVISFGSTNSHGQRDIERDIEKPPGVRRILLLGDSVVESLEVVELDDLMNRQLETLYPDGKTEVLNFGVNGYCTLAEVELLRTKGIKFQPDLVVLVFVSNDFHNFNAAAGGTVAGIEQISQENSAAPNSTALKYLYNYSHLFRLASARRSPFDPFAQNHEALGDNNVVQGLELLRKLADEHHFGVIVAIWPKFLDDDIADMYQMPGSDELLIEKLASFYRFPTVRLSAGFKRHWKSLDGVIEPRTYYTIGDSMHMNEIGSQATAQVLKTVVDESDELIRTALAKTTDPVADANEIATARQLGEITGAPDALSAVIELGVVVQAEGLSDKAIYYFELALEMDPNSPRAHYCLWRLYEKLGNSTKAKYHMSRCQR